MQLLEINEKLSNFYFLYSVLPTVKIMIMDKQREKDIQELCKQVLEECYPSQDYNRGSISCPFCGNESYGDEMDDIKHDGNCAYLIAKDLSTNGG